MNFLDRTGHIFSLSSYDEYPIGYEYQENPYIFWFDTEKGYKLSVDNYYFKPIRIVTRLLNIDSENKINVKIENSDKFFIIGSKIIEEKLMNVSFINDPISLNETLIKNSKELNYCMNLSINDTTFSFIEDEDNDLNGVITKENDKLIGLEKYYIDKSYKEVNEDDIINIEDVPIGSSYIDLENNEIEITGELSGIKLYKDVIGTTEKLFQLKEKSRWVDVTEYNESKLSNIKHEFELYLINTFYAVVNSSEAGVWNTNILINVDDEWCPITVGAEIIDEAEELIINGQNFGVKLPKEIVNAIYSFNVNTIIPDEKGYYLKMKEYLMNYMSLKGEIGSYNGIINALKWFEWDDKINISKLIKNDNRVQSQYVKDFFDIINDNIYSYQLFKETSLLSLDLPLYEEENNERQNLNKSFWGEGKPVIKSKLNKNNTIYYDEKEYPYIRGYFEYTFSDLGLKLCYLKYYYEKYFLPIYIKLHNISMSEKVYSNDIKLINKVSHGITANPVYINQEFNLNNNSSYINELIDDNEIIFNHNNYDIIYFNREYKNDKNLDYSIENKLYIDENYNHFTHYTTSYVKDREEIYYEINDTCLRIPISFKENKYYDVTLILSRYINSNNSDIINNDDSSNLYNLFKTTFKFIQTDDKKYDSLILYPKHIREEYENKFDSLYWLNNIFRIDLVVNGKLFDYVFTAKMPEFNIELGKLEYKYDSNFRQVKSLENDILKLNAYMYSPNLVNVNNYSFNEEIITLSDNLSEYVNRYYKENIKFMNKKYLNVCHLLELTDLNGNIIEYTGLDDDKIEWNTLNQFLSINNDYIYLYKNFFNNDGSYNFDLRILNINKHLYDLYLMHDYERWYVILISKECIDDYSLKNKKFKFFNNSTKIKIGDYILNYIRSDKKFLINRYLYSSSNGNNQFRSDDIIVASLKNNDKLSFNFSSGSKWSISPMSLGIHNTNTVTSNTELAIISLTKDLNEFEKGYYSITVRYSIDDYINHDYTKKAIFKIDNEYVNKEVYSYPCIDEILNHHIEEINIELPSIDKIINDL